MAITDFISYSTGTKGKPATWTCGKASIKAPVLNKLALAVQKAGSDLPTEGKEKLFVTLLGLEGKAGVEFREALDAKKVSYLEVVEGVSAYKPQRGRATGSGRKTSGKVMKGFAKAIALKFPSTMEKQAIFLKLLDFLEKTENQEAIYREFERMASVNGCDETTGMVVLRKMTPEGKEKAVENGKRLGEARAKNKTVPLDKKK